MHLQASESVACRNERAHRPSSTVPRLLSMPPRQFGRPSGSSPIEGREPCDGSQGRMGGGQARLPPVVRTRLTLQTMDLHCGGEPLRLIRPAFRTCRSRPSSSAGAGSRSTPTMCAARDVRAARPSRHVRRGPPAALPTGRRHGGAVHAQRGLQHDVRPRHHRHSRPGSSRRASSRPTQPETIDPLRDAGRPRHRQRRGAAQREDGAPGGDAACASTTCRRTSRRGPAPSGPTGWTLPADGTRVGRPRLRRRLLRHRRRGRPGAAGRARARPRR